MDKQPTLPCRDERLLTDLEACEFLRIRQRQLYSWRMQGVIPFIRKDGKFVPYAVIYRMLSDADPDADNPKAHFETLIVIKLDKENSRVVGKASGAKANDDAERLADRLAR